MTDETQTERTAIPLPDDFPVQWPSEDDVRQTWHRDTHHRPDPIPPLEADFWHASRNGWRNAQEILGTEPLYDSGNLCINGYLYGSSQATVTGAEKEAAKKRNEVRIDEAIDDMERRWQQEWQPEIQGYLSSWDDFDLDDTPLADLDTHLGETWQHLDRIWAIHFAIVHPAYGAMRKLAEYYGELFEDYEEKQDPFAAQRLFQAMPNLTVKMGHALWDLSRQAVQNTELSDLLNDPTCTLESLQVSPHGQDFATALDRYLDCYGHRPPTWTLSHPTWRENPAPVLKNLREYLRPGTRDPRAEMEKLAAERDESIAATRAKLAGFPQPARERFEKLLHLAQIGMILSEDHGVYIDFGVTARVRYVLLACGRRLAKAGALTEADDVFFLHYDEVRAALLSDPMPEQRALSAERRASFEHFSTVTPPNRLGCEPPPKEKPENKKDDPADEPGILRGNPCAPGVARGRVRILRSMTDTDALQPGEVMVATTTNPSFTPLFSTIAALLTLTGGKLSHGAVVAREYRIPAVLGVKDIFDKLSNGQLVEVDGTAGTIRLIDTQEENA